MIEKSWKNCLDTTTMTKIYYCSKNSNCSEMKNSKNWNCFGMTTMTKIYYCSKNWNCSAMMNSKSWNCSGTTKMKKMKTDCYSKNLL